MKKTLFLDRDGVLNKQIIGGYVTCRDEYEFLPHVLDALKILSARYDYIFIVTNQQCIAKGILTEEALADLHQFVTEQIRQHGGQITKVYYAPQLASDNSFERKPNIGMGVRAKKDYPDIDFEQAVMVGDSPSDMKFGKGLQMRTVYLTNQKTIPQEVYMTADKLRLNLLDFALFE